MNDLLRGLAPISAAAWAEIEAEAKRALKQMLVARKLVDFRGLLGWDVSALGLGRTQRLERRGLIRVFLGATRPPPTARRKTGVGRAP
jgi:uncharacterized linocin/CFP29 family protein